jgi:hypothetical protein
MSGLGVFGSINGGFRSTLGKSSKTSLRIGRLEGKGSRFDVCPGVS